MMTQTMRVNRILWEEPHSGQFSVEFSTQAGQDFVCFSDGYRFVPGEIASILTFYFFGEDRDDDPFQSNPGNKQELKKFPGTTEWDYVALGKVVAVEENLLVVDCGGILLPLRGVSGDSRCIGEFVGFRVQRLEVERCDGVAVP